MDVKGKEKKRNRGDVQLSSSLSSSNGEEGGYIIDGSIRQSCTHYYFFILSKHHHDPTPIHIDNGNNNNIILLGRRWCYSCYMYIIMIVLGRAQKNNILWTTCTMPPFGSGPKNLTTTTSCTLLVMLFLIDTTNLILIVDWKATTRRISRKQSVSKWSTTKRRGIDYSNVKGIWIL